jgi:hypothetical protein
MSPQNLRPDRLTVVFDSHEKLKIAVSYLQTSRSMCDSSRIPDVLEILSKRYVIGDDHIMAQSCRATGLLQASLTSHTQDLLVRCSLAHDPLLPSRATQHE